MALGLVNLTPAPTALPALQAVNVADLANLTPSDGDSVQLLGYTTSGDGGANVLIYRASGRSGETMDAGFYHTGPGADDYYEAADKSVANVRWFGATGDGATDDTTEIQAAIDSGAESVYVPVGQYVITGITYTGTADLEISGPGTLLVDETEKGIYISRSWGAATSCTIANTALNASSPARNVTRVTATAHGLVQGQVLKIISDNTHAWSAQAYVGELARVLRIEDANNFDLSHQLEDIGTGDTAIYYRTLPSGRVKIQANFDRIGTDTDRGDLDALVHIQGAVHPVLDIRVENSWKRCINLRSVYGGSCKLVVNEADDEDGGTALNALGYGIVVGGASQGVQCQVISGGTRHAFTTEDATSAVAHDNGANVDRMAAIGNCKDILVHDSVATNCYSSAFDTHSSGVRITFDSCHAVWPTSLDDTSTQQPIGFQDRSLDTRFRNCSTNGAHIAFNLITGNKAHGRASEVEITNCRDKDTYLRSISIDDSGGGTPSNLYVHGYIAESDCTWLEMDDGKVVASAIRCLRPDDIGAQAMFRLNADAWIRMTDIYLRGQTGELPPIAGYGNCTVEVNGFYIDKADATPYALVQQVTAATTMTLRHSNVWTSGGDMLDGIIRSTSAGSVDIKRDYMGWDVLKDYASAAGAPTIDLSAYRNVKIDLDTNNYAPIFNAPASDQEGYIRFDNASTHVVDWASATGVSAVSGYNQPTVNGVSIVKYVYDLEGDTLHLFG